MFGGLQIFKTNNGDVLLGVVTNLCAENKCQGMLLFLEYNDGKFIDVSEDYAINPDSDEVIKILSESPAFEDKESLKSGKQIPLAIEFHGGEKTMNFIAACKKNCDGGVIAKMFKWNGESFVDFEYQESP